MKIKEVDVFSYISPLLFLPPLDPPGERFRHPPFQFSPVQPTEAISASAAINEQTPTAPSESRVIVPVHPDATRSHIGDVIMDLEQLIGRKRDHDEQNGEHLSADDDSIDPDL
jgi:hypothetical protein